MRKYPIYKTCKGHLNELELTDIVINVLYCYSLNRFAGITGHYPYLRKLFYVSFRYGYYFLYQYITAYKKINQD